MIQFVIVNYNNVNSTIDFIESYLKLVNGSNSKLIIVDNSENKEDCLRLESKYNQNNITFIYPTENLGYLRAGGYALEHMAENNIEYDYFILCNNDIVFDDKRFILELESVKSECLLISPRLNNNGVSINPYLTERPSKYKNAFLDMHII
ncbi:glycosyltransferase [Photobacterium leiognathi]|uniref:glycosyltransferase n=1 Tax=Photobacterium leiognathi TaxID=553611 RepID=UPI002734DC72|nr:glycosyltransferase [Photobacterium leiognathi]